MHCCLGCYAMNPSIDGGLFLDLGSGQRGVQVDGAVIERRVVFTLTLGASMRVLPSGNDGAQPAMIS